MMHVYQPCILCLGVGGLVPESPGHWWASNLLGSTSASHRIGAESGGVSCLSIGWGTMSHAIIATAT